jgi:hypothetical protein
MAYHIAEYNASGFLPFRVHEGSAVPHTSHLFARFKKHIVHSNKLAKIQRPLEAVSSAWSMLKLCTEDWWAK